NLQCVVVYMLCVLFQCGLSLIDCTTSFFFFQAEDGIRDRNVTGVQTCALPISLTKKTAVFRGSGSLQFPSILLFYASLLTQDQRSEERRVGKECCSWRWLSHTRKKRKTA